MSLYLYVLVYARKWGWGRTIPSLTILIYDTPTIFLISPN